MLLDIFLAWKLFGFDFKESFGPLKFLCIEILLLNVLDRSMSCMSYTKVSE